MPNISGHFTGKCSVQTNMSLDDTPGHELSLAQFTGPQTVSDENWKDSKVSYWSVADLNQGSGQQWVYFVNEHPNGDRDCGACEAKVTNNNGQVSIEGTWKYTHGTGQFQGIQGSGTFKGRLTSPTEVDISWEGNYQLGKQARVA